MTGTARLGVYLAGLAYGPDRFPLMLEHAKRADELGFDAVTTSSHVVMTPEEEPLRDKRYRSFSDMRRLRETYPPDHPMLHPPRNAPWLEIMTTMAALAAVTSRVDLVTAIAIPPLYPAPLFAKAAATVDRFAQGRLRLGVTPSWVEGEYRALGADFARRGQVLDDTVAACRALWEHGDGEPVSFSSETVSFEEVFFEPKPPSPDGIPFYFGGPFSKRTIRRVATTGHGWLPWLEPPDRFPQSVRAIKDATSAAGRDPDELVFHVTVPPIGADGAPAPIWTKADLARSFERVPEQIAAGANLIVVPLHTFYDEPEEGIATLEHAAELWAKLSR